MSSVSLSYQIVIKNTFTNRLVVHDNHDHKQVAKETQRPYDVIDDVHDCCTCPDIARGAWTSGVFASIIAQGCVKQIRSVLPERCVVPAWCRCISKHD